MNPPYVAYLAPLVLAAVVLAGLGFVAWRNRSEPAAYWFGAVLMAALWWTVAYIQEIVCQTLEAKVFWANVQFLGITALPIFWLMMTLRLTGHKPPPAWALALLVVWAASTNAAAWTNDWHHFFRGEPYLDVSRKFPLLAADYQFWHNWIHLPVFFAVFLVCLGIEFSSMRSVNAVHRRQYGLLALATALPLAAGMLYVSAKGPFRNWNPATAFFGLSGLLVALARFRFRLFDVAPVARSALVEEMSDAALVVDGQGRVVDVNPAARRLLGHGEFSVLGRPVAEALRLTPEVQETLRREETARAEMVWGEGDERLDLEMKASTLKDWWGRPAGKIIVLRDITERRRAEEAQRRIQRRILESRRLESLSVLTGGVAHDFNNLLLAIQGNAEMALLEMAGDGRARKRLAEIMSAAGQAADLCRQMLVYAGKGRFAAEAVNLNNVVEETVKMLRSTIPSRVKLDMRLAPGLPDIEGDRHQLSQMVTELVMNAAEALGRDGGTVRMETREAALDRTALDAVAPDEGLAEGRYVTFEVADTGPGMDAQTLARVFEPFFTTKFFGRGLGLPAALGVARGHGGFIHARSRPGQGTAFRVLLPARPPAKAKPAAPAAGGAWQGRGTVLLVDDQEIVRELGQGMLEALGFKVLTASDGREAVEAYRVHQQDISCVLMDLTMPVMDGEEAFRRIKEIDPKARVIMSSGYMEQQVEERFGHQLAAFLPKPYSLTRLRETLRAVLEGGKAGGGGAPAGHG